MGWQPQMVREVTARLPVGAVLDVAGSARDGALVDSWSDLDLHLRLPHAVSVLDLLPASALCAVETTEATEGQVVRVVLHDGRRIDVLVETGRLLVPVLAADNDVRFLAALAMVKLGRRDQLIGLHLVLELLRACLVQAMLLRDRDQGTRIHRSGSQCDQLANQVTLLAESTLDVPAQPNVVEKAVTLYGQWRSEVETEYEPDWSPLTAILALGLQ